MLKNNRSLRSLGYHHCHLLLGSKMKDPNKADIKKQLLVVLFHQNVAGARNVSVKERYFALARDIGAIHEGEEPNNSKKLI